ncbi:ferrous iron transport protein A [Sinobacterium caligoides]|uniref:Ferrous iron transport protein A n=1 Tax=Sinobacterium caligoides TaxID=933926 RepID=A0A3N2E028_9GAMM|nr:FeoA family protein [Sinobacterium caligoides]ROS05440.1 ferrous iron transport protein A [Sinobacterium caligoides]
MNAAISLQTIPLAELAVGNLGRIVGYDQDAVSYRRKLMCLGLTPGCEFRVVRSAPLGDPIEIRVRGFSLSLRRDEAAVVKVERIEAVEK